MTRSSGFFGKRGGVLLAAIVLTAVIIPAVSGAVQADSATGLKQLNFLLGDWIGEGGGSNPGQGTGGFTFSLDLQNTVMVRKNFAEYPASQDKPAYRHDDLMIIYQTPGDTMRANYYDNEGHVINYTVTVSSDMKSVVFVSAASTQGPRFRMTDTMTSDKDMAIKFEIAPPGKPDAFSPYIEATAHRK